MTKNLTATAILESPDVRTWPLDVPEWGGQVYVRELSLKQRWSYIREVLDPAAEPAKPKTLDGKVTEQDVDRGYKAYRWLILNGICDKDGAPLFAESDWERLEGKSGAVLERLSQAVLEHNGLTEGAVEDAAGN